MGAAELVEQIGAEGAKVKLANDGKILLSGPRPLPAMLMRQIRETRAELFEFLTAGYQGSPAPTAWMRGIEIVANMECPQGWPENDWQKAQGSIIDFHDKWAITAALLGWDTLDLFGANSRAPYHNLASKGVALACTEHRLVVMLHDRATFITNTGAKLNHYKKHRHSRLTVPVWGL